MLIERLVIRWNDALVDQSCAQCSKVRCQRDKSQYEVMTRYQGFVCDMCIEEMIPGLSRLRDLANERAEQLLDNKDGKKQTN